jgi:hypothetical protein
MIKRNMDALSHFTVPVDVKGADLIRHRLAPRHVISIAASLDDVQIDTAVLAKDRDSLG